MRHLSSLLLAALLALLFTPPAAVADPAGRLRVIDADTFDVGGVTVRLFGADAPEVDQTCATAAGAPYPCGEWAAAQAAALFDGARVTCETMDTDRYGRTVARCFADGQDIAATLVTEGIALAYRDYSWDYDLAEKSAQVAGRGLWSGSFDLPADWRAAQAALVAADAPPPPSGDCIIKGNISSSGRIYHQPHNRDYDGTRIDTARGERWFCTAEEAEAAGWRPARN